MTDLQTGRFQLPQPLQSGELVGSRYRLDGVAGAGGMATVWRAYDERLQRPVGIKVISDELSTNPTAVARFAREARTHAGIQHPNLVQVYDYSVTAAQPYLVMEYISGSTLSARLDQGPFSGAAIRTLAIELLSAIACVHSHGVLHRDIKTGNVLLDRDGHARLTDFGLARLEDSSQITRTNEVVGTLRFLAPELIDGQPASRQSDLYAVGVLLRTVARDTDTDPPLTRLIAWLTAHDPADRPSDAQAVLAELRPSPAHPTGGSLSKPRSRGTMPRRTQQAASSERGSPSEHSSNRRQLRNRVAAVSALLIVAVGIAFAVVDAGGGTSRPRATSSAALTGGSHKTGAATDGSTRNSASAERRPTVEQQLQELERGVRRAAVPRP